MKLRSAQFVLLVLLFSSLSLSEGATLRLAKQSLGSGSLRLHSTAVRTAAAAEPLARVARASDAEDRLPPESRTTLAGVWPMRHPAAQAASVQDATANARA